MKSHSCGWRSGRGLGRRSWGCWRKRMSKDDNVTGVHDYMTHVTEAASYAEYQRQQHDPEYIADPRASAEALPESNSMINFKAFAQEYPDRLLPLLERLRPEFQELFAEYWLLGKSQAFIGQVHGFIQTRTWQNLRIIEQALGSMILLGMNPTAEIIRPILRKAGVETTEYGSLTHMIIDYSETQNYAKVAETFRAPVPAIRKIFRPVIATLLASKDVKAVAVGAYLRSLTHQASLTGAGLSKRCKARNRRVKLLRFSAPPLDTSPLISFNRIDSLGETPWCLLEISSEHRMAQIGPSLYPEGRKLFGKKPAQIFAPINAEGELEFGYIFARSVSTAAVRRLLHIRGIAEMAVLTDDEGIFKSAVTIPHAEVLKMIEKHKPSPNGKVQVGDFVKILTGEARNYCGTVTKVDGDGLIVQVNFPTGRCFLVRATLTSVESLAKKAIYGEPRMFWGVLGC